jgi:serine beta-lactamase-like protein LACTB
MGSKFYDEPRAFMQRPAAQGLAKIHRNLSRNGYGLLIFDAYRPWFVTKMFWEATPLEMRHFVANPDLGSRHNRGCAVDLTLYELVTGDAVPMVAGYDEFTERAYPDYPGGTSRQRWYRRLLRTEMERGGFEIYEFEWWHFDFRNWENYPILNIQFSEIGSR